MPTTRLTREVRFALNRAIDAPSQHETPKNSWHAFPRPVGVAPIVSLEVTFAGSVNESTGFLVDIKLIDEQVRRDVVGPMSKALIEPRPVAVVELALIAWERLIENATRGTQCPFEVIAINLKLCSTLWVRVASQEFLANPETTDSPMVTLTQQFEFSAAHRLHSEALSDEENRRVFGKCNNENGHGHNYVLDVSFQVDRDDVSDWTLPQRIEKLVAQTVIDELDHKHLNQDVSYFSTVNPTVENIAAYIWNRLLASADGFLPSGPQVRLTNVRVYETPKTWADFCGVPTVPPE